jgi:hypothetical protein
MTYNSSMFTIVETPLFSRLVQEYWTDDELGEFAQWLAENPEAGEVIPGSGGCRKVRWSRRGMGKRGGTRVIHYNRLLDGNIYLLLIYAKSAIDNIPGAALKKYKDALNEID